MKKSSLSLKAVIAALALFCAAQSSGESAQAANPKVEVNFQNLEGKENIVPFLVLGSGAASCSAALYGARAGIRTIVLSGKSAGQLSGTSSVENWPAIKKIGGLELMENFKQQAISAGAIFLDDSAASVDFSAWPYKVTTTEGRQLYALSLMIGTGATPRRLGISGEEEYWGKGVTTCAICDAPLHRGNMVVVVGGGDTAMEEALQLSAYAKEVHVLVRSQQLRASDAMIQKVAACPNIKLHLECIVTEIKGDGNRVTGIVVQNTTDKTLTEQPDVRGVFLAIGHTPNSSLFKGAVETDEAGYIKVAPHRQITNLPGVVAAGEVCDDQYRQAGVAAGDGIKAGLDIVKTFLPSIGFNPSLVQVVLEHKLYDPSVTGPVATEPLVEISTVEEFEKFVINAPADQIVVVTFSGPDCPFCQFMVPTLERVSASMKGSARFYKIHSSPELDGIFKKYGVSGIPHFTVFKEGVALGYFKGFMPKAEFIACLNRAIAQA